MEAFEVIKVIGRGQYGVAMLVKALNASLIEKAGTDKVVVKQVDFARLSPLEKKAVLSEQAVLGMFQHQHIIGYYEHFFEDEKLHIVMEYADGGALDELLDAEKEKDGIPKGLSTSRSVQLFAQLVSAVHQAHSIGVIHRDLKPANVFLSNGDVKLGDFGIAKKLEGDDQLAKTICGTPYYLAPELVAGKSYGPPCDMWAMGVVLYEIVSGRKPFEGDNVAAVSMKIHSGIFEPLPSSTSATVSAIIRNLLKKNPAERPTAKQLLEHPTIIRALGGGSSSASSTMLRSAATHQLPPNFVYSWIPKVSQPRVIEGLLQTTVIDIAVGRTHALAVTDKGEALSWMVSSSAQGNVADSASALGLGSVKSCRRPSIIPFALGILIQRVSCGESHSMALTVDGLVFAWGSNAQGQLGLGIHSDTKAEIASGVMAICSPVCHDGTPSDLKLVENDTSLRSVAEGRQRQWRESKPTLVNTGRQAITAISCGRVHSAALTELGEVLTWGGGDDGQTGHVFQRLHQSQGTQMEPVGVVTLPSKLETLPPCRVISCGQDHMAAIGEGGELFTWGNNTSLQTGHTELAGASCEPIVMSPSKLPLPDQCKAIQVDCGQETSLGILHNGKHDQVWHWGEILQPDGQTSVQTPPKCIQVLSDLCQVYCGESSCAAIFDSGALAMWDVPVTDNVIAVRTSIGSHGEPCLISYGKPEGIIKTRRVACGKGLVLLIAEGSLG